MMIKMEEKPMVIRTGVEVTFTRERFGSEEAMKAFGSERPFCS